MAIELPKKKATRPERRDSNVATLLTLFLPGAGHVYLGRAVFGAVSFAVVMGLYLLGLKLSGGMSFEYLQEELRGPMAPILAPEAGNIGGFMFQMRRYGFGPGQPRPWPSTMHWGVLLTALSGVANACLAARAHFDARNPVLKRTWLRDPAALAFTGWVVPGLGHFLQGRRKRAFVVFACLVGLFLLGTLLAHGSNLDRERHFYYWSGQFLLGLPAIFAELIHGHARVTEDIPYVDAGLVFGCVAGLLNIMMMIDVYGYQEERLAQPDPDEAAESRTGADALSAEAGA